MLLIMRTKDFIYRHLFGMKAKTLAGTERMIWNIVGTYFMYVRIIISGYIWFSDIHKVSPYMDAIRTLKGSGSNP